jgi:hypothetical protein
MILETKTVFLQRVCNLYLLKTLRYQNHLFQEGMMKKYVCSICVLLIFAVTTHAETGSLDKNRLEIRERVTAMAQAGVPEDKAMQMVRMMEEKNYRKETVAGIEKAVIEASEEGLPTEPLASKAFEGMAKGVPEQAIVRAINAVKNRYAFSYRQMKQLGLSKAKQDEIGDDMADCMAAGMGEKDMSQIMERVRTRIQSPQKADDQELARESVLAARTMARMGAKPEAVRDVICEALEKQYNSEDMAMLQNRFRDQARTRSATLVAHMFQKGIANGNRAQGLGENGNGRGGSTEGGTGSGTGSGNGGGSGGSSGNGSGGSSGGHGSGGHGR